MAQLHQPDVGPELLADLCCGPRKGTSEVDVDRERVGVEGERAAEEGDRSHLGTGPGVVDDERTTIRVAVGERVDQVCRSDQRNERGAVIRESRTEEEAVFLRCGCGPQWGRSADLPHLEVLSGRYQSNKVSRRAHATRSHPEDPIDSGLDRYLEDTAVPLQRLVRSTQGHRLFLPRQRLDAQKQSQFGVDIELSDGAGRQRVGAGLEGEALGDVGLPLGDIALGVGFGGVVFGGDPLLIRVETLPVGVDGGGAGNDDEE